MDECIKILELVANLAIPVLMFIGFNKWKEQEKKKRRRNKSVVENKIFYNYIKSKEGKYLLQWISIHYNFINN